ncbi:WD40 repeat domain-containing protein [Leptospira sp. GIMC2001]|uniref:WD40 repeat domain-containing protein n=1 Tax=Leptospira sp. GIMC2001 TaxID=1513297 RepID=UPI00234A29FC|nr:hypothetical protein [Leptospira sp. GIMC2001]WCL47739.1 hypothetical protein O4O04_00345 [Leptospira sp. GIMC2001]
MILPKPQQILLSFLICIIPIYSIEVSRNPRWSIPQSEITKVFHTAISPNQEIVAIGGKNGFQESSPVLIQIRNLYTGKLMQSIDGLGTSLVALSNLKFSKDGKFFYAVCGNKILFWSTDNWKLVSEINVEREVLSVDLSSNNQLVAVANSVGDEKKSVTNLLIYNRETGKVIKTILKLSSKKIVISQILFSHDDSVIYGMVENSRHGVVAWNVETGAEKYFASQKDYGRFAIHEKSNLLVSAEAEKNKINLFNLETGKLIKSLPMELLGFSEIVFHPNGEYVIVGRRDSTEFIQILNVKTNSITKFVGHMQIFRFDLSSDGSSLAVASFFFFDLPDNISFAVYDIGSKKEISQLSSSYGAEDFKLGHEVEVNLAGEWTRGFVGQIAPKIDQVLIEFPDSKPKDKLWAEASSVRFINIEDRKIDPLKIWNVGDRVFANVKGKEYTGAIEQINKDLGWILVRFESSKPKSADWVRPWNLKKQ